MRAITAKYSGVCKVTGLQIIAGETPLEKIDGKWQVARYWVPERNEAGQPRYEIKGMDKTGEFQPACQSQAFNAWFRVQEHWYGHDHHPCSYDFTFAEPGTTWKSHMGLEVRVNWKPEPKPVDNSDIEDILGPAFF